MNANLPPKPPVTVRDWLSTAAKQLAKLGILSARLDAELLLSHSLRKSRSYMHAHPDTILTDRILEIADARLDLRSERVPIAYIVGHKEFYGRTFRVTPATLIPRPESETMITLLKELLPNNISLLENKQRLIDVGTGCGCLGITAKLEAPELDVTLIDISRHALKVAEKNARILNAEVTILKSDLLVSFPFKADFIIANLPYVDQDWERSPETDHEPAEALFARQGGLQFITKLLPQAARTLPTGGILLLEADPRQHAAIVKAAHNFKKLEIRGFVLALRAI